MDATVAELQGQLNALRFHIEEAARRNSVLTLDTSGCGERGKPLADYQEFFKRQRMQYAVLEYSARIVGLYGAVERFIESSIIAYLGRLNAVVPTYDRLPERLRDGHTEASAQLLQNRRLQKYASVDEKAVIENMLSCTARTTPYHLNAAAYTHHTANFRVDTINEFFSNVGVQGLMSLVRADDEFRDFLNSRFPTGTDVAQLTLTAAFEPLEEIASRRNEIAHGAPSELVAPDILSEWIDFVDRLGQAVVRVLRQDILKAEVAHRATALPQAIAVYDNRIVCFELIDGSIAIGDRVVAKSGDGRWIDGRIERLEVNHKSLTTVVAAPGVKFAAALTSRVRENHQFFHIRQEPAVRAVVAARPAPIVVGAEGERSERG